MPTDCYSLNIIAKFSQISLVNNQGVFDFRYNFNQRREEISPRQPPQYRLIEADDQPTLNFYQNLKIEDISKLDTLTINCPSEDGISVKEVAFKVQLNKVAENQYTIGDIEQQIYQKPLYKRVFLKDEKIMKVVSTVFLQEKHALGINLVWSD